MQYTGMSGLLGMLVRRLSSETLQLQWMMRPVLWLTKRISRPMRMALKVRDKEGLCCRGPGFDATGAARQDAGRRILARPVKRTGQGAWTTAAPGTGAHAGSSAGSRG